MVSSLPLTPALRHAAGQALLIAAAAIGMVMLVVQFDAAPVLAGLVVLAGGVALVLWPQLATLLVVLLLYINVPAILTQQHGLSEAVAGAPILLLAVPLGHALLVRRESLKADTSFYLMLAFLAALLLSSLWAVDKGIAVTKVRGYVIEGLLLYWLMINVIRDLPTLRRVMATLLVAGSLVSALCLYQDVAGAYDQEFGGLAYRNYEFERDGYVTAGGRERGRFDRAQGPVNEPNRFAQILIVLLPMAVYLYRSSRSQLSRLGVAAGGILILIGIVLTLSRGAIVALALMGLAMVWLKWIHPGRVAMCTGGLLLLVPFVTPFYLDRITSIANVTYLVSDRSSGYREADGAIRGRATEMLAALHVSLDYPAFGVGPGQFAPFYVEHYSRSPDIKFRDIQGPRRAHTLYFELAAENGLVGLLLFLAIVLLLVVRLWRARRQWLPHRREFADLATAYWLSLLAYLWTGIFLHLSYQRYYWFLLALATAALHALRSAEPTRSQPVHAAARGGLRWRRSR